MSFSVPISIRPGTEVGLAGTTWHIASLPYSDQRTLSDATALPEGEKKPPAVVPPTGLDTPDTDKGLGQALVKSRLISTLNSRFSKVMPAVGLAAFLTHVGYFSGPYDNHFAEQSPYSGWIDRSSEATWQHLASDRYVQSSATFTSAEARTIEHGTQRERGLGISWPIDDQPRFDVREALDYAKTMGLATEFPL